MKSTAHALRLGKLLATGLSVAVILLLSACCQIRQWHYVFSEQQLVVVYVLVFGIYAWATCSTTKTWLVLQVLEAGKGATEEHFHVNGPLQKGIGRTRLTWKLIRYDVHSISHQPVVGSWELFLGDASYTPDKL